MCRSVALTCLQGVTVTLEAGNRALLWALNCLVPLESYLMSFSRFVSSLLEEPEVVVVGAGQGPAGSIIHKLFVNAQRVSSLTLSLTLLLPLTLFTRDYLVWL